MAATSAFGRRNERLKAAASCIARSERYLRRQHGELWFVAATARASLRVGRTPGFDERPPTRPFGRHSERMDLRGLEKPHLAARYTLLAGCVGWLQSTKVSHGENTSPRGVAVTSGEPRFLGANWAFATATDLGPD